MSAPPNATEVVDSIPFMRITLSINPVLVFKRTILDPPNIAHKRLFSILNEAPSNTPPSSGFY